MKLLRTLKKEWFLIALFAMVGLASLWPELGRSGGLLHLDLLGDFGVALIFFLTGLGLPLKELAGGMTRWRIHVFVQASTYLLFPLLGLALTQTFKPWLSAELALGFAYLCALPSTISSSIAMTQMARGNVPAAIFNATISSLLGIVLTPALLVLTAQVGGHASLSFAEAVFKLGKLVALPLLAGQLARPLLASWHQRNRRYTGTIDRAVILLLVLGAFSDSVQAGLWRNYGAGLLFEALLGAGLLLALVLSLTTWAARRLRFSTEDEIAAVFCGSKKTLASGIPMATLIFGAVPGLGVIVLPIMFYHQLQLITCSVLAARYARRPG